MDQIPLITGLFRRSLDVVLHSNKYGMLPWSTTDIEDDGQYIKISYFPYKWFANRMRKEYGTRKLEHLYELGLIKMFGRTTIRMHKFFIPEMIYLLSKFGGGRPQDIAHDLATHTWVKDMYAVDEAIQNDVDMSRIDKEMNVRLYDWQEEFIKIYDTKRRRAHLNGELLSFGCGLGKTITGLATLMAVGCDGVVIVAPKSTLEDVWVYHIRNFFKKAKRIFLVNKSVPQDADFFIFNYESMDKIESVMKFLKKKKKLGVIVDECHNFLDAKSLRSQNLVKLRNDTGCENILLLSGTPVKAIGNEVLALLQIIDTYLDDEAKEIFKRALGLNTTIGTDILHARLDMVMHRKTMDEVFTLPPKTDTVMPVKITTGADYTLGSVKKQLQEFMEDRLAYHKKRWPEYEKEWSEAMNFLYSQKSIASSADFERYQKFIKYLAKKGYNRFDKYCVNETVWANLYEKNVLIPPMSKKIRDGFLECKSKIKYLDLCIQGEALGYLDVLRSKMAVAILQSVDVNDIVVNSLKKVIFATSYVSVVEYLRKKCDELGFKPICIYGKTSKDAPELLNKFREDKKSRVLICTMQTLSTGVTLTEANTVVFCNEPWRGTDREQMAHRTYRIGQDTECQIISLHLDTGGKSNLSDRTQEILDWSREMADAIVDGK